MNRTVIAAFSLLSLEAVVSVILTKLSIAVPLWVWIVIAFVLLCVAVWGLLPEKPKRKFSDEVVGLIWPKGYISVHDSKPNWFARFSKHIWRRK